MNYYIDAWKNYVNFEGRARRKAFWMFVLFNLIATIITSTIDSVRHPDLMQKKGTPGEN